MGFRQGAYAKVWEVTPVSNTRTKVRVSISRKNKQTGEYEQDFGGYVSFVGTACAAKAASLCPGSRVKLGDVDLQNKYDAEKKQTYYYPTVFSFELQDDAGTGGVTPASRQAVVDSGDPDEDDLPF